MRGLLLSALLCAACGDGDGMAAMMSGADGGAGGAAGPCARTPCEPRVSVARAVEFRGEKDGISEGFDLDGKVSDDKDTTSCGQVDFKSPDGTPGIDNQFSVVSNTLMQMRGDAVEGLVRGAINDGTLLILFQLDGLDDYTEDPCVDVSFLSGKGKPFVGTDGKLLAGQTFELDAATPPSRVACARLSGGVLTAGPFEAKLPFQVLQVKAVLDVHGAYLRATISPDGSMDVSLGAGVEISQVSELAHTPGALGDGQADLVDLVLESIADLAPDASGACKQVSVAIHLQTVQAFFYQ